MITQFKIFENINEGEPEIGDYVIVYPKRGRPGTENIVGIIVETQFQKNIYGDTVKTYKIGLQLPQANGDFWHFTYFKDEIEYWSKNKEELETVLTSNKYNI